MNKEEELISKAKESDTIYIFPIRYNSNTNECLFSEDSIEFYKYAREQNKKIQFIESNPDIIALHDASIWLPVLYLAETFLLPVVTNLISNFIYDKIGKKDKTKQNINLKIKVKNKGKIKELNYNGSVESFEKTFKDIDVNKLFNEDEDD